MKNSIYQSAQLYDDIHWWKKNDMTFWSNVALENNCNSVLELASGTGRLAHIFLKNNIQYTGIEINQDFVDSSINKLSAFGDNASFLCKDMCKDVRADM